MSFWTDDRRLTFFTCTFPVGIMALLPFSSFAFDFLMIFACTWTVAFLGLNLVLQKPIQSRWFLVMGLSAIVLRLVIVGVALRKITVQGPAFDGQILRSIGEPFHSLSFEAHVIFSIFVLFTSWIVISLVGREVSSAMHTFLDLAKCAGAGEVSQSESEQDAEVERNSQNYRISDFFARLSILEIRLVPLFLAVTVFTAIIYRDRLLPVTVEKSVQTSAVMILSLILYSMLLSLLSLAAQREWTRGVTGKPVGRINLRFWIFEHRFRLMAAGLLMIGMSFLPDFPKIFLVTLAGIFFSAGFLSDVIEGHNKVSKIENNLIANDAPSLALVGHQVTLRLGREIWNEYYVLFEQKLHAALGLVRLNVIKESGIIFGEISVEFNNRLRPHSVAVVLNDERVTKASLALPDQISEETDIRGLETGADKGNAADQLTKIICDHVTYALRCHVPSLSHDPAIDHLVKSFEI